MTSTTAVSKSWRSKRGFTLAEILIATVITGLLLAACMSSVVFLMKSAVGSGNYSEMNQQSRRALEYFGREVRQGQGITSPDKTGFDLKIPVSASTSKTIRYGLDKSKKEFYRIEDGVRTRLLGDVEDVIIRYYNINGSESALPLEIKQVQMEAKMVRKVLTTENTNYLISARFTLRNNYIGQ